MASTSSESTHAPFAPTPSETFHLQEIADAWHAEIERRWREIENGTAITLPASEVFARARAALK